MSGDAISCLHLMLHQTHRVCATSLLLQTTARCGFGRSARGAACGHGSWRSQSRVWPGARHHSSSWRQVSQRCPCGIGVHSWTKITPLLHHARGGGNDTFVGLRRAAPLRIMLRCCAGALTTPTSLPLPALQRLPASGCSCCPREPATRSRRRRQSRHWRCALPAAAAAV